MNINNPIKTIILLILSANLSMQVMADDPFETFNNLYYDKMSRLNAWYNYNANSATGQIYSQMAQDMGVGNKGYLQNNRPDLSLVQIELPSLQMGCDGISFSRGSIDWGRNNSADGGESTAKEFLSQFLDIGGKAVMVAGQVALSSISPSLANAAEMVQNIANLANMTAIDSCEAAKMIVGAGMNAINKTNAQCVLAKRREGYDMGEAKKLCQNPATNDDNYKWDEVIAFTNGNLAWYFMMQDNYFKLRTDFAEIFMNLIGTVVFSTEETVPTADNPTPVKGKKTAYFEPALPIQNGQVVSKAGYKTINGKPIEELAKSTARAEDIFRALLWGKDTQSKNPEHNIEVIKNFLTCLNNNGSEATEPKEGCLHVDVKDVPVQRKGYAGKLREVFTKIFKVLVNDPSNPTFQRELETDEKNWIRLANHFNVPIYRLVASASARYTTHGETFMEELFDQYLEMMGYMMLHEDLEHGMEIITLRCEKAPAGWAKDANVMTFCKNARAANTFLKTLMLDVKHEIKEKNKIYENIKKNEAALVNMIAKRMQVGENPFI